ncbi:rifin PIR protein, putative [Plasmodium reichenowi]|uniref:Rifin PIR protein, putative n=1 Tax=Plasmodium reichenowi TaxID=5854 RepID=A0A2P9D1E4_PLARE|nr:rifin PIR protein, putative [Plasmodium reichenowi]
MKLHYSEILLFFFPLNILAHTKNKPSITPHHTQTNRSLCESDTQSSNYDKDADMKSVMQQFDDCTSQRFEEYQERMKDKRQKRKEECDKNIQKIIEKDKMEKSLAEGCLKCGCALGGVAASVGLFGGLGIYGWKSAAIATVEKAAAAKGAEEGMKVLICRLKEQLGIRNVFDSSLGKFITTENYLDATIIFERVKDQYKLCSATESTCENIILSGHYSSMGEEEGAQAAIEGAKRIVEEAVNAADNMTISVTKSQMETVQAGKLSEITAESSQLYSAIGYSVLDILIIVLVMIIIYLVLRYRQKKKMNKKAQYTKLLNQ